MLRRIAKYVTKVKTNVTKGMAVTMQSILKKTINNGLSTAVEFKTSIAKLLSKRMMSKQERSHLTLLLLMVPCSYQFFK